MSFSNELKSNNINLWNKTHVEHPFVLGMKDGSLEFNSDYWEITNVLGFDYVAQTFIPQLGNSGPYSNTLGTHYYKNLTAFLPSDTYDNTPLHGDWVVEAFNQQLDPGISSDLLLIDLDTVKSGENRSGLFFSSWSLTSKLAGSIGTWLALTALSWISFNTGLDANNSPSQLFGLKFLFSTLPSFFFLTAIIIIWKYPITEEMHSKIRDQLKNTKNERILETQ